jgi:hypothetical protein
MSNYSGSRRTLTAVHRPNKLSRWGAVDEHDAREWTVDSFADLTQPHVLAALGFSRERSGRANVWTQNDDDTSLTVEDSSELTVSRSYKRPVVTVTLVAGWHRVVSCSFVWTDTPMQGPAFRTQVKSTRNNNQKAAIK